MDIENIAKDNEQRRIHFHFILCLKVKLSLSKALINLRDVWIQQGVKIPALETKYACFDYLLIWLQKLKELDLSDLNALVKDLNEFSWVMVATQSYLARKIKFIEELKVDSTSPAQNYAKQIERSKNEDELAYVKLLIKLTDASQFLGIFYLG